MSVDLVLAAGRCIIFGAFCFVGSISAHQIHDDGSSSSSSSSSSRTVPPKLEPQQQTEFYKYDGVGNNINHPTWGAAGTGRTREWPPQASYVDGTSIPRSEATVKNLPSARRIMEELFRKVAPYEDKATNQLLVDFGLFVTTDATKSAAAGPGIEHSMDIPCDGELVEYKWCPVLGINFTIPFQRTIHNASTGGSPQVRQSINQATSFLDLSNIYGMDEQTAREQLLCDGGMLPLDERGLPVLDELGKYIIADSKRATLSPGVFSLFTIFMRYHNLRALEHAKNSTYWTTSWELFQLARMDTIALYQSIVEQKYVPSLLGSPLDPYTGYDPSINPSVDVFFSTVAMRYGHSALAGLVRVVDRDFNPTSRDPILMRDAILNVGTVMDSVGGVEPILRGLVVNPAKAVDASIVDDFLIFNAASVFDIQRGRDSGIPPYNEVRKAFNLSRAESYEELAGVNDSDNVTIEALRLLYGENGVDHIDTIVGALLEEKENDGSLLGPVFTSSLKKQYQRLRDGDRLWYKNRLNAFEYGSLPTLGELIKLVGRNNAMENFPSDAFLTLKNSAPQACSAASAGENIISLMDGRYKMSWNIDNPESTDRSVDIQISIQDEMEGPGYIGIGWIKQRMRDADIWMCRVNSKVFKSHETSSTCTLMTDPKMFSCCVASGEHLTPQCSMNATYPVTVKGWCMSESEIELLVRAPICDEVMDGNDTACLQATGAIDFIAAFNLLEIGPHGPQKRASGSLNLISGSVAGTSTLSTDQTGFFAAHGLFMLFNWMILVPVSIYIARYMKTRSWRVVAHISLMSCVGSLMIPIITTSGLVAPDSSNKNGEHRIVGLALAFVFILMALTGRLRYLILQGRRKSNSRSSVFAAYFHAVVGMTLMLLSFWNCYTGLVRIGPNDTYIEIFTVNSKPLGYDVNFFGTLRTFYWPYVGCVLAIFAYAEFQILYWKYRTGGQDHTSTIWKDDSKDAYVEKMSLKTFLELTRNGRELCIVDGRVLDLNKFQDFHPGGRSVLRFAHGSDITNEFIGTRDVDGIYHFHSPAAKQLLRKLVTAILDEPGSGYRSSIGSGIGSVEVGAENKDEQTFERARVVGIQYLTPALAKEREQKQTIMLRVALPVESSRKGRWRLTGPRHLRRSNWIGASSQPSQEGPVAYAPKGASTFTFRARDRLGGAIERQFTPVSLYAELEDNPYALFSPAHDATSGEQEVDFLISLLPGGKMSKIILATKPGRSLLIQGPRINPDVDRELAKPRKTAVMFAAGTGISPVLQLIHSYVANLHLCPEIFLVWVLKSPEHCYLAETGIEALSERSRGRLRWMVLYSGKSSDEEVDKTSEEEGNGLLDYVTVFAEKGPRGLIQKVMISSTSSTFFQTGSYTVGGFLKKVRSKVTKVDRYNPSSDDSDSKKSSLWQDSGVFLEGAFDEEFLGRVFQTSAPRSSDLESGSDPMFGKSAGMGDDETAQAHRDTLVVACGPPNFEATALGVVKEIGLSGKQVLLFTRSTQPMPEFAMEDNSDSE